MQLLGGDKREALREVEAHLMAEHAQCAHAGAVLLPGAFVEDALEEVVIGLHDPRLWAPCATDKVA